VATRKNKSKQAWLLAAVGVALTIALLLFLRDRHLTDSTVNCGDPEGARPRIDLRQFETNYSSYSVSLEAEVVGKGTLRTKVEPTLLQKLTESIQTGQEFRKALVAGYDACAVTKMSYQSAILRYQTLDGLARQIQSLGSKSNLSASERNSLSTLINEYIRISQNLGG
jgi:hypothetical protein